MLTSLPFAVQFTKSYPSFAVAVKVTDVPSSISIEIFPFTVALPPTLDSTDTVYFTAFFTKFALYVMAELTVAWNAMLLLISTPFAVQFTNS